MQDEHANIFVSHLPGICHTSLSQFDNITTQAAFGSALMQSAAGAAPAVTGGTPPASRQGPGLAEWRLHHHSSLGALSFVSP